MILTEHLFWKERLFDMHFMGKQKEQNNLNMRKEKQNK